MANGKHYNQQQRNWCRHWVCIDSSSAKYPKTSRKGNVINKKHFKRDRTYCDLNLAFLFLILHQAHPVLLDLRLKTVICQRSKKYKLNSEDIAHFCAMLLLLCFKKNNIFHVEVLIRFIPTHLR